jgi:hypothetical protein
MSVRLLFTRSIKTILVFSILSLFASHANGVTFIQFGDTAGLPYPATDVNVSLKEADVNISTESLWTREVEGFEPHHNVLMKIQARYVIQNDMNEKVDLPLKIPLPTSLNEELLRFMVNGVNMNYSSVEYDNPRQKGTGLHLFTLNMVLDANSENVLDVIAENGGVGSIEEDFTFMLTNAAKWSEPVGKIVVSAEHENSLITGYSISPMKTILKAALWEFNSAPEEDLTMRWKVLTSPVSTQASAPAIESSPIIPPIIAIIVGGLIVGAIAYVRVKRKRAESVNHGAAYIS